MAHYAQIDYHFFQTSNCNGAQRLMSRLCLMASSCVHAVTSFLMCAAL